jgi:hypothetical protein
MSPPRKPSAGTPTGPSKTSHLFGSRKPGDRAAGVTSESISADLDAFQDGGGRIEVLGTTRTLSRIGQPAGEAAPAPAPAPSKPARGRR